MSTLARLVGRLLHGTGRSVSYCGVRLIALLPRNWWYPALWQISRLQTSLIWPIHRLTSDWIDRPRSVHAVWVLNYWISRLVSAKGAFPIPIRIEGLDLIHNLIRNPTGTVVCSAHMPLLDACLQSLIERGYPPAAVIANRRILIDSRFPVWGKPALPGLPNGQAVLLKVRSVLRNGGFVAALVDDVTGAYSPNLFRIVKLAGAKLVFVVPELRPNGDIEVEFFLPPDPSCQTEESIHRNLQVLQARADRILHKPPSEKVTAAVVGCVARDPPKCFANH